MSRLIKYLSLMLGLNVTSKEGDSVWGERSPAIKKFQNLDFTKG